MKNIYNLKKIQKAFYKSIVSVFCPLLNEVVYFTSDGFIHLLYESNRMPRNISEQFMKLKCLPHAPIVIQKSKIIVDTRTFEIKVKGKKKTLIQYALAYEVSKGVIIRVVVGRLGAGKLRFISVMPHNNKSKKTITAKIKKHP